MMKLGEAGLKELMRSEGYRKWPYNLGDGRTTIGYGETNSGIVARYRDKGISEPEARQLLEQRANRDYIPHIARLASAIHYDLDQNQIDALASFIYNLGPGTLEKGTTMGNALRSRVRGQVAKAFLVYDKARINGVIRRLPGLTTRRQRERLLWLKPALTPEQIKVLAWRQRLDRVRKQAAERRRKGQDPWPANLHALADELKRNIRRHT